MKEAKKNFKAEQKAAKKAFKEAKKAQKHKMKAAARRQSSGESHQSEVPPTPTASMVEAAPDFTFPVEVGDGRRLTISWNRADNFEAVAQNFAAQHGLWPDEIPTIIAFLNAATFATPAAPHSPMPEPSAPSAPEEAPAAMDVSEDATPDNAPPYSGFDESQLQTLEQMGFPDRELNIQMLAAHNGDIASVLEKLL